MDSVTSLLIQAARNGDAEALKELLASGAAVNESTSSGQTALIVAAVVGNAEIVNLLLEAGAEVRLKDHTGLSAIDWAERRGFAEISEILRSASPEEPILSEPIETARNEHAKEAERVPKQEQTGQLPRVSVTQRSAETSTRKPESRSDDKARKWIEGLKRRMEEQERRMPREEFPPNAELESALRLRKEELKQRRAERESAKPERPVPLELDRIPENLTDTPPQEPTVTEVQQLKVPEAPATAEIRSEESIPTESNIRIGPQPLGSVVKDTRNIVPEIPAREVIDEPAIEPTTITSTSPTTNESSQLTDVSNLKRCPRCNKTYNSELLAYCSHDATPLVSADSHEFSPPRPASSSSHLVWVLVTITIIGSASVAFFVNSYFSKDRAAATIVAQPSPLPEVKEDQPVLSEELSGKEIEVPTPEYPERARSEGVSGTATVRVRVNKRGRVISVRSVKGNWQLLRPSLAAARKATFSSEKLAGKEATGTITYVFKL